MQPQRTEWRLLLTLLSCAHPVPSIVGLGLGGGIGKRLALHVQRVGDCAGTQEALGRAGRYKKGGGALGSAEKEAHP